MITPTHHQRNNLFLPLQMDLPVVLVTVVAEGGRVGPVVVAVVLEVRDMTETTSQNH
jgi:hypothetical protein